VELIRDGLDLVDDFRFSGGGLKTFPGLYSPVNTAPFHPVCALLFIDSAIEPGTNEPEYSSFFSSILDDQA
jgi:hypothetical protein